MIKSITEDEDFIGVIGALIFFAIICFLFLRKPNKVLFYRHGFKVITREGEDTCIYNAIYKIEYIYSGGFKSSKYSSKLNCCIHMDSDNLIILKQTVYALMEVKTKFWLDHLVIVQN